MPKDAGFTEEQLRAAIIATGCEITNAGHSYQLLKQGVAYWRNRFLMGYDDPNAIVPEPTFTKAQLDAAVLAERMRCEAIITHQLADRRRPKKAQYLAFKTNIDPVKATGKFCCARLEGEFRYINL